MMNCDENIIDSNFINVVSKETHDGILTKDLATEFTENYSKPALFEKLVPIDDRFTKRSFYERNSTNLEVQWRRLQGNKAVSMRSSNGSSDYNYVTGQVGVAVKFLDDIFNEGAVTYSHLGTISSGYNDP